jgi:tRNA pseudouridine55 synthase
MSLQSGKRKREPVHGVLLLDKAADISSNGALTQVKRLFNAEKAGHTGTLDPFATGLLPLCLGEATKFSQDLLDADKSYEATVHLGITTTTGDTEGEATSNLPVNTSLVKIEQVLQKFRGEISQVPPMYSALKRDGKALYEYAREGITLERAPRNITIHLLELIDYQAPLLRIRVTCSKGTYIRVLGEELGRELDCGAHLTALRRTAVGMLKLEQAVTLDVLSQMSVELQKKTLLPVDMLVSTFPSLHLSSELTYRFMQGQRLALGESAPTSAAGQRVRVYCDVDQRFLGVANLNDYGVLAPERLIAPQ